MKVKHEYERMPANEVWNAVVAYINKNKQFLSSTGINTKNVKPYIDRKQSPFVGLLKSVGIIE